MLLATRCLAIGPSVYVADAGGTTQEQLTVCVAEKDHAESNGHMWMLIEDVTVELTPVTDDKNNVVIEAWVWGVGDAP